MSEEVKDEKKELLVFGMNLSRFSSTTQFWILALSAMVSALLFSLLQEGVFAIEGFKFGGFATLLTTLTYCACAWVDRVSAGDVIRKGSLKNYFILSVFTVAGMYFTNWSLDYLSYPMRVIFKSSKVIPVMLVGAILLKRRYSMGDYLSALVLVAGIVVFSLGDSQAKAEAKAAAGGTMVASSSQQGANFDFRGVFLVSLGVLFDAVTANFEEKKFFGSLNCSHAEVVFFSSLIGSFYSAATLMLSGELWQALDHAATHPEVLYLSAMFSVMGYFSVTFVLLLIKHFNATSAEVVKSVRKVLSIILSYTFIPKPLNSKHVMGGALFAASIAITLYRKALSSAQKKQQQQATAGGAMGPGVACRPNSKEDGYELVNTSAPAT